jgi:hypothetical protein
MHRSFPDDGIVRSLVLLHEAGARATAALVRNVPDPTPAGSSHGAKPPASRVPGVQSITRRLSRGQYVAVCDAGCLATGARRPSHGAAGSTVHLEASPRGWNHGNKSSWRALVRLGSDPSDKVSFDPSWMLDGGVELHRRWVSSRVCAAAASEITREGGRVTLGA